MEENVMSFNVGGSDYAKRKIQPWHIWQEYNLDPWDADIVKRVLREKEGEDPTLDYYKMIHICQKQIDRIKNGEYRRSSSCDIVRPQLPVKIILEDGVMPTKSTDGAAAYDLYVPKNTIIRPGRNIVCLHFRMELPYGIGATVNPRSGFTSKGMEGYKNFCIASEGKNYQPYPTGQSSRMDADVKWGLIDCDYRGLCGVLVYSREKNPFLLEAGTKFAQMCFQRYEDVSFEQVEKLNQTERGTGGFGSTGTK